MMAAGLIALASMVTIPATSASGSPSVTGLYKFTEFYAGEPIVGPLVLYPSGEVKVFSDTGEWAYNGVEIVMVFDNGGCSFAFTGEGNPSAGFGGTGGEGPAGKCGPGPYGASWSMKKA
jgi:hypothetical protein